MRSVASKHMLITEGSISCGFVSPPVARVAISKTWHLIAAVVARGRAGTSDSRYRVLIPSHLRQICRWSRSVEPGKLYLVVSEHK